MKRIYLLGILSLTILGCNESKKDESQTTDNTVVQELVKDYPENVFKVFEAHGGLDRWNDMQTLVFTMNAEQEASVITTDLKSRKALIETEKFKLGFDGKEAWVEQDSLYFNNDPNFYYDLMFYFYAMPFVLADDGITYSDVKPLIYQGVSYPGVKVSYGDGVGISPEDEYILYYNPDTNRMEWLGYTVTYFSKEKSSDFHYIKYHEWQDVDGLSLPKSLQWYGFENDSILGMENERTFSRVKLLEDKMDEKMFQKNLK